jgi:hypothetical protein
MVRFGIRGRRRRRLSIELLGAAKIFSGAQAGGPFQQIGARGA